jgi:UDP-3-O-[3-hydroxymyristoyl] N-acetylglucosamine deacetylase
MVSERTLKRSVELEGIGVHSGRTVRLCLRPSDTGRVVFRRTDLSGAEVPLDPRLAVAESSTVLRGEGCVVRTVEHLLASLLAAGIGSCVVELDGEEVPILDGSALPFVRAVEAVGTADLGIPRPAILLSRALEVEERGAWVRFEPPAGSDDLALSYSIAYDHPSIGVESRSAVLDWRTFAADVAPARTFGFLKDLEDFRRRGLAKGAGFENTIVLDETSVVNPPLRFEDEFVRHKLLDLAGDLGLLGRRLIGRVSASRAGHRLHLEAVRRLLEEIGPGDSG